MSNRNSFSFISFNQYKFYFSSCLIGFITFVYFSFNYFFEKNIEIVEWLSYYFILLFFIIYLFVKKINLNLFFLNFLNFFFFFNAVFFIILTYKFQYSHFLLLFLSFIILYFKYKKSLFFKFHFEKLDDFLFVTLILYFTTFVFYWSTLDELILYKVSPLSEYISLAGVIETIVPIVFFISLFLFLIILSVFQNNTKDLKSSYILYLSILPLFIFFVESFSTYGFFKNVGGGAMYHWQAIVGPNEMMDQNGYLLWDTPTNYGFLNHVLINLIPIENNWLSFYYLNSLLTFIFSMIIFYTLWHYKNLAFFLIALVLTYSIVFLMPSGAAYTNISVTPATGSFRFIWIVLFFYTLVCFKDLSFYKQFFFIYIIYIIGFLWSFESAFFLTCAITPIFIHYVFFQNEGIKNFFLFALIPISLVIICVFIIFYYQYNLSVFPDFFMFIETSIVFQKGFFSQPITNYTVFIVHLVILSILLFYSYKNKYDYIIFSLIIGLWSISGYFIGQSEPIALSKIFVFYIFVLFLTIKLLPANEIRSYLFNICPIILVVIVLSLSNPALIKHIERTITNQDYNLSNVKTNENSDLLNILNAIDLNKNTPVYFVEKSRYLNILFSSKYFIDLSNINNEISHLILFPFYPPSTLIGHSKERIDVLKKRWISKINKNNFDHAYVIFPEKNFHWSKKIREIAIQEKELYKISFFNNYNHYDIFKLEFPK